MSNYSFAQNDNYDIYILLDDAKEQTIAQIQNDSLVLQVFRIKEQISYKSHSYFIDSNGELKRNIKIKGAANSKSFNLIYKNDEETNMPFIRDSREIENILRYPKDFDGQDLSELYSLLKKAKRLFVIESGETFGYYLIKKVELSDKKGSL